MKLYFFKATYTNNVYKISDFYTEGAIIKNPNKMLDINFKPDDGITQFITKNIALPDLSFIRDHTHFYVDEFEKIYKISSIDYLNIDQIQVICDEDPLIANYLTLIDTDIVLSRTNDPDLFLGVNDISDMSLYDPIIQTEVIESNFKTGKWALLIFQDDPDTNYIGLNFSSYDGFEQFANLTELITTYPEINTDEPSKYTYFQKTVFVLSETKNYQCVYDGSGTNSRLYWVEISPNNLNAGAAQTVYIPKITLRDSKIQKSEVGTTCIVLPFEGNLRAGANATDRLITFQDFSGPINAGQLLDIKIIDGSFLKGNVTYNLTGRVMIKTISGDPGTAYAVAAYQDSSFTTPHNLKIGNVVVFNNDIDISSDFYTTPYGPNSEPFFKYDLYVYGKKFTIPYYMINNVHIRFSLTAGVINYIIYYNEVRNIIATGSFTHSIKWAVDQLDAFYNQNPTYKEQFFTKLGIDAMKNVVGGAIGGSVVPGIGTAGGAVMGLASAGLDAGISLLNLHYMEKGLALKPDQIFGDNADVALQMVNIFGIYWVKRTGQAQSLMRTEYDLRGFPTNVVTTIADLNTYHNTIFSANSKIVFGEVKSVIKNEYVTGFINQKLKEGVVFIL